LRELIDEFYFRAAISKVVIRKTDSEGEILIFTAKPAAVIGKDGKKLEEFEQAVKKLTGKTFKIIVKEVRVPELSAKIMSEFAAMQLENRMPYRRVAKSILQKVMEK
jgi:small subunit ribosomal protein S3